MSLNTLIELMISNSANDYHVSKQTEHIPSSDWAIRNAPGKSNKDHWNVVFWKNFKPATRVAFRKLASKTKSKIVVTF